MRDGLSPSQRHVLEALRDHPFLTARQVSWHLRKNNAAIQRQLWQLQRRRLVRRYPLFVEGERKVQWLYTLTTQGLQTLAGTTGTFLAAYQQKHGYSISRLRWLALVLEHVYHTREVLRFIRTRAALYARVSNERQDSEEKVSIDTQIRDQEIDRLSRDLDRLAIERQWIITESDMEYQLREITEGETTLRKEREEKSAALVYRERAEDLARFGENYLTDLRDGLRWLNQDIDKLDCETRQAVFAERRRVVKLLVKRIVVHKTKNPDIVFSIPIDKVVLGASTESPPIEP